jgi:uncharacterized membrane protein
MSYLVVIAFEDPEEAGRVRETLRGLQHRDALSLDDSAVVVRDQDGKIHVKNEMDRGVKIGAVGGGLIGLLIGGLLFPIGGLLLGSLAGAAVGKMMDMDIDKKFVQEVSESIPPGGSALFFIVRDAVPDMAIAALKPYKGTVLQTTLPTETEEELRRVLKKRI